MDSSGQTLLEIQEAITQTVGVIMEVSDATNQQSEGISRVNAVMSQMEEVTHQNADLAAQTSDMCKTLTHESNSMDELIGFFKTS